MPAGMFMQVAGVASLQKHFLRSMQGPVKPWVTSTDTEYAVYVELGTALMKAPQPFMGPAAQKAAAAVAEIARISLDVNDLIRRVAFRVEKEAKKITPALPPKTSTRRLRRSIHARPMTT